MKAVLAVEYLRVGRGEVHARHVVTLNDEEISWKFETPSEYVREMLRAIETANNHERGVAMRVGSGIACTCLVSAILSHARQVFEFSRLLLQSPSSLIQHYACKFIFYDFFFLSLTPFSSVNLVVVQLPALLAHTATAPSPAHAPTPTAATSQPKQPGSNGRHCWFCSCQFDDWSWNF